MLRAAWDSTHSGKIGVLYATRLEQVDNQDAALLVWRVVAMQPHTSRDYFQISLGLIKQDHYENAIDYLQSAIDLENRVIEADPDSLGRSRECGQRVAGN